VSKKTVTFKMPVKSAASAEDASPPVFEPASGEAEQAGASGQDEWVSRLETDQAPAVLAAPSLARGPIKSVTIDLTTERDFPAVAALMLTIPPMLGWFYLANVVNRYWNRLG
jgi:hypothetical protein